MLLVDILAFDRVVCILRGRRIIPLGRCADSLVLISVCVSSGRRLSWKSDGLKMPIDGSIVVGRIYIL